MQTTHSLARRACIETSETARLSRNSLTAYAVSYGWTTKFSLLRVYDSITLLFV